MGFAKILAGLSKQPEYEKMCKELLKLAQLKPNNGTKTDPAHPAIYPTGIAPKTLKPNERKVYDLVVKRFMAAFAKPAVRETMEVFCDVKEEIFIAKGTRTIEESWHIYYKPYLKLEEITLPEMKEGDTIAINKIVKHDKETQPPRRFNQSSIIKELEKRNLGTKATRADILDRLFQRGYIGGVQITVTELGMKTIAVLEKFAPLIVDEKLTADFEEDMEKIRGGKEKQEPVLEKAKKFLISLLADFRKKEKEVGTEILKSIRETADQANYMGPCPKCKVGRLMVRRGKFGRFIGCDKYPGCKTIFNIPRFGNIKFSEKQCERCNYPIIEVGAGKKKVTKCINQECTQTSAQQNKEAGTGVGKKSGKIESKATAYPEEGMLCPTCKEGKMVLRRSFYGAFLGCNNYPKCQTMMRIKDGKVDKDNPIVKKVEAKKVVAKKAEVKKAELTNVATKKSWENRSTKS